MAFWVSPGQVSTSPRAVSPVAALNVCRSCPAAPSRQIPSMASWRSTPCSSGFTGQSLDVRYVPSTFRPTQRHRLVTKMASKVTGMIKLALPAGKANPSPPVGPALGAKGVNIMAFCKDYNAATQDKIGTIIPVEITVFEDRSFTFILKTPPASILLKKAANIQKGSGTPQGPAVGSVTADQIREIAETKLPDLNCTSLDSAYNIIAGTAKGMGIKVKD